jgi:hypothetical protein
VVPIPLDWVLGGSSSPEPSVGGAQPSGAAGAAFGAYPLLICVFSPLTWSHREICCDGLMQRKLKTELGLLQSSEGNYTF